MINQKVDADEIFDILSKTGAWKAPGEDLLPTGFLKACGPQLWKVLAQLTNASFALEHYPRCFRHVNIVVLPKPGKSAKALRTSGGYRPIVLISSIGKVIETAIARRIVQAVEAYQLLPEGQIENRPGRSTELAIKVITEAIYTTWRHRATASLFQLDIKGAFNTVNHIRLLDMLWQKGFPI
jgi:hypothetical protein